MFSALLEMLSPRMSSYQSRAFGWIELIFVLDVAQQNSCTHSESDAVGLIHPLQVLWLLERVHVDSAWELLANKLDHSIGGGH